MNRLKLMVLSLFLTHLSSVLAEPIAQVRTDFELLGRDGKLAIYEVVDPLVPGVRCYISLPIPGGISGSFNLEQANIGDIDCQAGPVLDPDSSVLEGRRNGEEIFRFPVEATEGNLRLVRFYRAESEVLIYLLYNDQSSQANVGGRISTIKLR